MAQAAAHPADLAPDLSRIVDPEAPPTRTTGVIRHLLLGMGTLGILLSINQVFNLRFLVGYVMIDTAFFYIMLGIFLSLAFLIYPARVADRPRLPWYDWGLFALTLGSAGYLALNASRIVQEGWELSAPPFPTAVAGVVCALALEGVRRAGGVVLFLVCVTFFLYPLYAESMPGFLWGPASTPMEFVRQHALGTESIVGLPLRTATDLLIGFLVFGSALVITGGGAFFMSFATALLGWSRGGPAKVSVMSSGLFGMLSGSVISNVVTTGKMTIPTMRRNGYPPHYAGAVEACASTGGALMPPVMGAVAFLMAEFLNVPYATIITAAALPAVLYYLALLLQADMFAARNGLKGQARADIPALGPVLRDGWYFLFAIAALIYLLLWLKIESHAPWYVGLGLIGIAAVRKRDRFGLRRLADLVVDASINIANIVAILVGIGMVVGALSYTGVGPSFSGELLHFAGDNVMLILVLGAVTSFILGMGMTSSACYIFLAVVMGPALVENGVNPVAGHLFILYWSLLSFITPPVAIAAITAATIAGSGPSRTGFTALRLGLILFFLPFLFVLNPTLILHGEPLAILHDATTAVVGVFMLSAAFEGWLYGIGRIGIAPRVMLALGAIGALVPGWETDVAAFALLAAAALVGRLQRGRQP